MQKVTEFLEKNVQWLAIGLGAFFVLYMTYLYVLQPPAKVTVGTDTFTASEIDSDTLDKVAKTVQAQMHSSEKVALPPVPKYVETFRSTMGWQGAAPVQLAGGWPVLPPLPDQPAPGATPGAPGSTLLANNSNTGGAATTQPDDSKVTSLPVLPPAISAETKFGRSVVLLPGPDGTTPQPPQPGQPGQPGQPIAGGVDKDWLTQLFHINVGDIDAAFKKAKIPDGFYNTTFLQVEMERVEVDDSGKPIDSTKTIIPPINVWHSNQPPPPFPGDDAPRDVQGAYLTWAAANTQDILQPGFYVVAKGDQWSKPGTQVQDLTTQFDPKQYVDPKIPIPTWVTPEQKKEIFKARQEAEKAKAEQRKAAHPRPSRPAPAGVPGSEGGAPGVNFQVGAPPARPPARPPAGAARPNPRAGLDPAAPHGPGGAGFDGVFAPGVAGPAGGYGGAQVPGLPVAGQDYPSGEFSPADPKWSTKTIEGWCHDETVKAGKTYRYQIRYKIKSPVWAAGNVTDPATLSNVFGLTSEWGPWSDPVAIPPLVNFFVKANKSQMGNTVSFDVFRFDKGEQHNTSFAVSPGDPIGGVVNGIDFGTGWTVVDFREDPRQQADWQILLVNDQTGKLVTRSYSADRGDALYKALKEQVAAAKATETAAAGSGAPGGGAPVMH